MDYTSRSLRELELILDSAESILPSGDSVYKGFFIPSTPYRAKNIFSNDTSGNDPALEEATKDFYEAHDMLNSQLINDGLNPIGLPKNVRTEDLGEIGRKVPTKYGGSVKLPVGIVKAYYDPDNDEMVINKRIIYGTKEHAESRKLYKVALKFVDKYVVEHAKKVLKPFYGKRKDAMESKSKSRSDLKETAGHELTHKKQKGVIKSLIRKYKGKLTDYVRNMIERHCISYTSKTLKRRTTQKESSYGQLEDQAIRREMKKRIGPESVFKVAEKEGHDKGAELAEKVYGIQASMN